MEYVIQKAVELGVYEIIPVEMKYCVVRLDDKKRRKKRALAGDCKECRKTGKAEQDSGDPSGYEL